MGTSSSKYYANATNNRNNNVVKSPLSSSSSSSSSILRRSKSSNNRSRLFQSSCPRSRHFQIGRSNNLDETEFDASKNKPEPVSDGKEKLEQHGKSASSTHELDEWGQLSSPNIALRMFSSSDRVGSSRAFSSRSLNPFSRFSLFPGNVSFRLSRESSVGSSRPGSPSSTSFVTFEDEANRNTRPHGCDLFPACFSSRSRHKDVHSASSSDNIQDDEETRGGNDIESEFNGNFCYPRSHTYNEGTDRCLARRWVAAREPVERNVRFSRTLSVGRLRERVLRRSSPDLNFYSSPEERALRAASQGNVRRKISVDGVQILESEENAFVSLASSDHSSSVVPISLYGSQNNEIRIPRAREARYHGLLERGSNFLERRRRMRSQVRALQRLGSRIGHERSCDLSGQNRTGHCTCHISRRELNSNEDAGARASISRIVMLAEALFEVLDEIRQQSVVLSSRPSVSPIGSVPAPNEVVESLPVKSYSKTGRHHSEEVTQCYICLVEHEEGDKLRILPCHHEFHLTCIDKWLKEIQRACPLCRRDICKSNLIPSEL